MIEGKRDEKEGVSGRVRERERDGGGGINDNNALI